MSLAINDNYCREVNPRYEIMPPPPARQDRASLRDSECEISKRDRARGKEWAGAVNVGSENRPFRCQRCQSSRAEHEWMPPPIALFPSCFFFSSSSYVFPHLFLFPSLPLCILEYHCGAEIRSLTSAGLHNENKWAGSKYAGCVLFTALYQSAHRLSSKIKMDCVAKSP